jgi:hypothetical protein
VVLVAHGSYKDPTRKASRKASRKATRKASRKVSSTDTAKWRSGAEWDS